MALYSLRLRRALSLSSSLLHNHFHSPKLISPPPSISSSTSPILQNPRTTRPFFSELQSLRHFRSSPISSFSSRNRRFEPDNQTDISEDTILFEGCDYNHWLITVDFRRDDNISAEQKVQKYVEIAAGVFGSEEEAKKKIYACSTTTYEGFQVECSEETSEKFKENPAVVFVLPDSYIDPVNKEYGGDKYINGTIIPRPPPITQARRNPRQFQARRQGNPPPPEAGNFDPQQNYPPQQQFGPQQNYPPRQQFGPQQNHRPQQQFGTQQNHPPEQQFGTQQNHPPEQQFGPQQNHPPQQQFGTQQNHPPQQPFGTQQNHPPEQYFGPQQNYPPQQNVGPQQSHPQQSFGPPRGPVSQRPQNTPPHQPYGQQQNASPQRNHGIPENASQQNYGYRPPQHNYGQSQNFTPQNPGTPRMHSSSQQNYGPPGRIEGRGPTTAPGGWDQYHDGRGDFPQGNQRYTYADSGSFAGQTYTPAQSGNLHQGLGGAPGQEMGPLHGQNHVRHGEDQNFSEVDQRSRLQGGEQRTFA